MAARGGPAAWGGSAGLNPLGCIRWPNLTSSPRLVQVTVKVARVKPFMRVKYIMTKSAQQLEETMVKLSEADGDPSFGVPTQFLEATVFTKDTAVIQCGEMCDPPSTAEDKAKVNGINWWWKPFYFRHLQHLMEAGHDTYEEEAAAGSKPAAGSDPAAGSKPAAGSDPGRIRPRAGFHHARALARHPSAPPRGCQPLSSEC